MPHLDVSDSKAVIAFCRETGVSLVVVGPEGPLVAGLVDALKEASILAFGPSAAAAQLEGSKAFMKRICDLYDIPTARYKSFTDPGLAREYLNTQALPIVVKADGLAAGKGVVVASTLEMALAAVDSILVDNQFGAAGASLLIEEFLVGEEASFFALVDGEKAIPFGSAQDHKAVGEGDTGPNTGGMGAYSPAPLVTPAVERQVMRDIIKPTVRGMAAQGCAFVGVLYAGLMIDPATQRAKLLEYNVRFGDPECQVRVGSNLHNVHICTVLSNHLLGWFIRLCRCSCCASNPIWCSSCWLLAKVAWQRKKQIGTTKTPWEWSWQRKGILEAMQRGFQYWI